MNKYIKFKNFIPESYVEEKKQINENTDKKGILIMIITALILFPFSISNMFYKNEEISENEEKTYIDINKWQDIIKLNYEGKYTDDSAVLIIRKDEKLKEILKNKKIYISKLEHLSEDNYEVEIKKE